MNLSQKSEKKNAASTDFVNMLFAFTYIILNNRQAIYSKHMLSEI